jgi:mRNA-degrading endonuclease HigB of HigAB toxin-antitoxin module
MPGKVITDSDFICDIRIVFAVNGHQYRSVIVYVAV